MGAEESIGAGVVAEIGGEGGVGAPLHDRGAHAVGLSARERNGIAEVNEARAGERRLFRNAIEAVGHAEDAEAATGAAHERLGVRPREGRGAGAVQEKIGVIHRGEHRGRGDLAAGVELALDDLETRKTPEHHGARLGGEGIEEPERDLRAGDEFLDGRESSGGVRDVADVHHLPSGTEQDARGAAAGLGRERREERGGERSMEKRATIHGECDHARAAMSWAISPMPI